jgi:hypothetical protein
MRPRKAQPQVVPFLQHVFIKSPQLGQIELLHVQLPLSHRAPLEQTFPQEPQLLLSLCVATHAPLQLV